MQLCMYPHTQFQNGILHTQLPNGTCQQRLVERILHGDTKIFTFITIEVDKVITNF